MQLRKEAMCKSSNVENVTESNFKNLKKNTDKKAP